MRRLSVFAKGNVDVHDSLHSFRLNGEVRWNGLNAALRAAAPGVSARLRHETLTRSDALLAATGAPPPDLAARSLPLGAYPLDQQFSDALFTSAPDVFVLSIQPDVATGLMRSHEDGVLFYPSDSAAWTGADRTWLRAHYAYAGLLDPDTSAGHLVSIVERIRVRSEAPILVYNVSAYDPGDNLHCYQSFEETLSTRIKRFNLNLVDVSRDTGISIVDVDRIVAGTGARNLKVDVMHLNAKGHELICFEVVRILDDLGML